jgi:pullulanase/glycogen debranching enzyme
MNNLALSTVMFSQGVPFFHAGDDILRSKSFDRNSYNSGDWFNRLDLSYGMNNFGVGLPPAGENERIWELAAPLLAAESMRPTPEQIQDANAVFREYLQIRFSSPLFRLRTAEEIQNRVRFLNTGGGQTPGVVAMMLDDSVGEEIDPQWQSIVVIFNATPEEQSVDVGELQGITWELHPVLQESVDPVVRTARGDEGVFTVPAYTTAVFVVGLQD